MRAVQTSVMMTAKEARECITAINETIAGAEEQRREVNALIVELHERQGWRALGYANWRDCVTAEFSKPRTTAYRMLEVAKIRRESAHSHFGNLLEDAPDSHVIALQGLPADVRGAVYAEVKKVSSRPSVDDVQSLVDKAHAILEQKKAASPASRQTPTKSIAEAIADSEATYREEVAEERRERLRQEQLKKLAGYAADLMAMAKRVGKMEIPRGGRAVADAAECLTAAAKAVEKVKALVEG